MDFSRRLRLFLFGIVLGSVIMYFYVLKDRNIYKMPKDVIKEKLLHFPLQLSTKSQCQVDCNNIDTASFRKAWASGDIDFSLSKVNEKPCPIYHITLKGSTDSLKTLMCSVCDDFVVLQEIVESKSNCDCK
jgi:hypothetical protein